MAVYAALVHRQAKAAILGTLVLVAIYRLPCRLNLPASVGPGCSNRI